MKLFNRNILLASLALLALTAAVWLQTCAFGYIFLDDPEYTFKNPFVCGGFSLANAKTAFTNLTWGAIWMPITNMTYMFDISIFGPGPFGHHLTSTILHAANTLLFFCLLLRICGRDRLWLCVAMSALWACHPLRAESVAWISSRKDLVFTFFCLLGLHGWLSGRWFTSFACMCLAVCGKPTAMAFPFVCLSLDFIVGRRPNESRTKLASYALMLVAAVATGLLTCYSQTHGTGLETPGESLVDVRTLNEGYGTFAWRCLNAAVALGMHFYHAVTTDGIHLLYLPKVDARPDDLILGLVCLALVTALTVWAFVRLPRRRMVIVGCALWFFATIGPTLGVAGGFGFHAYADRFTYWPFMAFSVLGGLLIAPQRTGVRRTVAGVLTVACLFYAFAAFCNAATYCANFRIFEQAAISDPNHYVARGELGAEYCRMGRVDEGVALLRDCLYARPTPEIAAHLATTLATRGKREDIPEIRELCSHVPPDASPAARSKADDALGTAAMYEYKWDEAIGYFKAALSSPFADGLGEDTPMKLAMCYFNKKDYANARKRAQRLATSTRPSVRDKAREMLQRIWQAERPQVFVN